MKLYGFPGSPNTWKVRALADHIGAPLELEVVDLTKGAQKAPSYLALNPTGRTPTLVDGDYTLWESTAIMQYVASKTKTDLWPDDAKARGLIMQWQSWQLQHWARACEPLLFENVVKRFFNLGPASGTEVAKAVDTFKREAAVLDAHLGRSTHLVGDRLTLADFSVAAYLLMAEQAGMPIADFKSVQRWFGAVASLPCWSKTAPKF